MSKPLLYSPECLTFGIHSYKIDNSNGLEMHILESGESSKTILLLHGFPEIAYSWRKIMPMLANHKYRVIAPDLRGFGLTSGWDSRYDCDLSLFRPLNIIRDILGLLTTLQIDRITMVVGHDYGASIAAYAALIRPDIFQSLSLMSAPFSGPPLLNAKKDNVDIATNLAQLERPRKHYQWYYATHEADGDIQNCTEGIHNFLRAYFHYKSADWKGNKPFQLESWSAEELAKMPTYYIMDLDKNMPETVAPQMPTIEEIAKCEWLPDDELRVYSNTYFKTGFQGGLNHYRCRFNKTFISEQQVFSGCTISVPTCFISGASDWGVYQVPGALETMETEVCSNFLGSHLIKDAGHWVQQERPDEVIRLLLSFLKNVEKQIE
ncbi:MAG: alpha/beta hydrolase [Magnetovibrio sp.]|nr:alpha/beta hydrolase [Magnetovibrio sp.]